MKKGYSFDDITLVPQFWQRPKGGKTMKKGYSFDDIALVPHFDCSQKEKA